jgi:osmotically-inducible protein OsmY
MGTFKITTVALASTLVLLAAGCNKTEPEAPEATAAEQLDSAIAATKQESQEAGAYMEQKTDSAMQTLDDAAITTALKAKLVADDQLKALDINVDTVGGVVTLTGTAPTDAAKAYASELAATVDGVTSVTNDLTVN